MSTESTILAVEDKVVVEETQPENTTDGGIIIPDGVKQLPQCYGIVLSTGPDVNNISKGDVIMFHPNGGQVIIHNGKIGRVLSISEIYGVVK